MKIQDDFNRVHHKRITMPFLISAGVKATGFNLTVNTIYSGIINKWNRF